MNCLIYFNGCCYNLVLPSPWSGISLLYSELNCVSHEILTPLSSLDSDWSLPLALGLSQAYCQVQTPCMTPFLGSGSLQSTWLRPQNNCLFLPSSSYLYPFPLIWQWESASSGSPDKSFRDNAARKQETQTLYNTTPEVQNLGKQRPQGTPLSLISPPLADLVLLSILR